MKSALFTIPLLALALAATGCSRQQTAQTESDSLLSVSEGEAMMRDVSPEGEQTPAETPAPAKKPGTSRPSTTAPAARGPRVPAGTGIAVKLDQTISSKTATVGQTWAGTVSENVVVDGDVVIPAGATVTGVVTGAKPAKKGDRAMLDLALSEVNVGGKTTHLSGGTEAVIAGSTRARNLGAIAGGAAAGALIGKAVGGDAKDAVIGGVIGGAAATGAVAASQGYQVELKPGTVLTFNVTESVTLR